MAIKVRILDSNGNPKEGHEGTAITDVELAKINWRGDNSLSFVKRSSVPTGVYGVTQIVTNNSGDTYVVPPSEYGKEAIKIGSSGISEVNGKLTVEKLNVTGESDFGGTLRTTKGAKIGTELDVMGTTRLNGDVKVAKKIVNSTTNKKYLTEDDIVFTYSNGTLTITTSYK